MDNDKRKDIYLLFEVERAIKFLRLGLAEIQNISGANAFYDPIFMYLSSGIERLFKVMITLGHMEREGYRIAPKDLWDFRKGHDLMYLKTLVEPFFKDLKTPWLSKDYMLLKSNDTVDEMLLILGEYGQYGRYFDLDNAVGRSTSYEPKKEWERFETIIGKRLLGEEEFYNRLRLSSLDSLYSLINKEIVTILEQYFRALTRQFVHGAFPNKGSIFWHHVSDFSDLQDEQLGITDYRGILINAKLKR